MKRPWWFLAAGAFALWTALLLAQARPGNRPAARVVGPRPPLAPEAVTFSKQIVRVLQTSCQKCHHDGGIAPFPLMTYPDAYARRFQIADQTARRKMPPWHVEANCQAFEDDPSLSERDIQTIGRWITAGAPEGDPRDLPPPLTFPSGWSLGPPAQVLSMEEAMVPDFSRGDLYRCFVMPANLAAGRFVRAVEVVPGSRAMVHHVLVFADSTGAAERLDREDPGPGYTCFGGPGFLPVSTLGVWAPGNVPRFLPDGVGIPLPAGSRVVIQVHYSARSGVREADRTSIGLHFAELPIRKRLLIAPVESLDFRIPAGAKDHEVRASIPYLPVGVHLLAITPHMHLLGRKMSVSVTLPDGHQICLAEVPDWDFHWQRTYFYKNPIALPAGSRVDLSARYDNSSENPHNPSSPPRDVAYGEKTTDEMCIALLSFTLDSEDLASPVANPSSEFESVPPFGEVDWPVAPRPPAAPMPPRRLSDLSERFARLAAY